MAKITVAQLSAFNSPVISKLLSGENRQFPVSDAFVLADNVALLEPKLKVYTEKLKSIIDHTKGKVDEKTGRVLHTSEGDRVKANAMIAELNKTQIEIPFTLLKVKDNWPKLTVQEAMILQPMIDSKAGKE